MSKIVVVGANHAGTACINTMLDNFGNENEIVVFDQNSNISFLGCGMALWIGEQIDGPEGLFYSDKEKLEAKGAKVYMNSPVLSIDYDNKVVTAEVDGKEHKESYEKLIFATGSTPIIPPIKGVEIVPGNREFKATLENLQFVKLYQNAEEVIEKLKDNSKHLNRIAVVGGGYIGVELAEAFERLGKEVILVDIVDTVLNGYYDKDFTQMMAKNLEDHNIVDLYWFRDENAISETDKKYGGYCNTIANNILYNLEDSKECVNDTYLKTWNSIPPTRPKILKAFLGKITRNLALNIYKSKNCQKRKGEVPLVLDELKECIPSQNDIDT